MGSNCFKSNANCVLLSICFLQFVLTVTRQVFDFLGHIWASILFNFLAILVIICGCFGGCEKRNAFLYVYCIWQIIAFFWNMFIIMFYLEIGSLFNRDKDLHILNFGTGSRSWFESNGPLCQASFNFSIARNYYSIVKPTHVEGCLLYYFVIETIQAAVQIILAIIAFAVSYMLIYYNNQKSTKTESRRCLSSSASLPAYSISMRQSMRRSFHEPEIESLPSFYDLNQYTLKSSRSSLKSKTSRRPSSPLYINSQVL